MRRLVGRRAAGTILLAVTVAALAGSTSNDPSYYKSDWTGLIQQQAKLANASLSYLSGAYNGAGVWGPYTAPDEWEKSQYPAIGEAVLALYDKKYGSISAAQSAAKVATDTVNAAIADHQTSANRGNFDPPAESVGGSWWAVAQGEIAITLHDAGLVSGSQLRAWERSMVRYADFLVTSGNASFYVNGNVNLRFVLADLEAWQLAGLVGDKANRAAMLADYQREQQFVDNPCGPQFRPTGCPPASSGAPAQWGWNQVTSTTGYFSETAGYWPYDWSCANTGPCTGVDWEYLDTQLNDALTGYVISGYNAWWQNVVVSEFGMLAPRVSGGMIDLSSGSRHSYPTGWFYPSAYAVLDEHNLSSNDSAWTAQLSTLGHELAVDETTGLATLYWNEYLNLTAPATGLLDGLIAH